MRGRLLAALSALLFSQGLAFAQQLGSDPDQWAVNRWRRKNGLRDLLGRKAEQRQLFV